MIPYRIYVIVVMKNICFICFYCNIMQVYIKGAFIVF